MFSLLTKISQNKKILTILGLIILFLIFFLYFLNTKVDEKGFNVSEKVFLGLEKEQINQDSDGDGLKDWEEILKGFDPMNSDSDGDGVSDKEEVERQSVLNNNILKKETNEIELAFIEDNPDLSSEEKIALRTVEETINKTSQTPENPEKPILFQVSPEKGPLGSQITLRGSGFTETGNTIYAGYTVFRDVPSLDGLTLTIAVNPPFPEDFKGFDFPIEYWLYVENKNGLSSDEIKFSLEF